MTDPVLAPDSASSVQQLLERLAERVSHEPDRVAELLALEPEPLLAFTPARTIVAANRAAETFFGYGPGALVGITTDLLLPHRLRQPDAPALAALPDLVKVELPALSADGVEMEVEWTYRATTGRAGPIFLLVTRDATKIRESLRDAASARAKLREAESRHEALFENSPIPLLLLRYPEGIAVRVNRAFLRLFEVSEDEVLGKAGWQTGLSTPENLAETNRRIRAHGDVHGLELDVRTKSERPITVRMDLTPVVLEGVRYYLGSMLDVTERRRQAEVLSRAMREAQLAREEAERASRGKDEFLATMSHELRSPLNAILGWSELLLRSKTVDAEARRGLEIISRNARAQERMIGDLLDVSRIANGTLTLSMQPTSLGPAILHGVEAAKLQAEAKNIRIDLDVEDGLPQVQGDPARLQQVIEHLVANAVKFTPRGGRVEVGAVALGSTVVIRVADDGIGIEGAQLPSVFDRFHEGDAGTTQHQGGLGLGLSIVKHLVEAHGGTATASSEGRGRGAIFEIILPALPVVRASRPTAGRGSVPPGGDAVGSPALPNLGGVRVLVVEDEKDSLDLLRTMLEEAGAAVTPARNAYEALDAKGPFDLVVSDIGMPDFDGYTLIKTIRSRETGSRVPAIALTAFARPEDVERARRAGFQEHFAKPVDAPKLIAAVARWSSLAS